MSLVRISGYNISEGVRDFRVLDRGVIEEIIDDLDFVGIYKLTYSKAYGYSNKGFAYAYIDVITGDIETRWLESGVTLHPWDSFNEVILCDIDTPVFGFSEEDLLDSDELEEFGRYVDEGYMGRVEEYIEEVFGRRGLEIRLENALDYYALEFEPDYARIEMELDNLYSCVID